MKKGIKKMLVMVVIFCLVVSMMPSNTFVVLAETTKSQTTEFDTAKAEAKEYIDNLTINNTSNEPSKVVSNWGTQFSWDNEKRETNNKEYLFEWSYYNGVVFEGLDYIYDATKNTDYSNYVTKYLSSMIDEEGNWTKCSNNSSKECAGYKSNHGADCYKSASLLMDYYNLTGDERYKTMAEKLYQDLKNAQSTYASSSIGGNYNHTWDSTPTYKVWLDGVYMIQPFMAEYAAANNDIDELNKIAQRFAWIGDNMYDSSTGLYYHAANSSDDYYNNNNNYWGRAIGWYAAAMVDVMDDMDATNLASMKTKFKELVDGMIPYQTKNGMWRQFVNNEDSIEETSVTALMAYAIQKAVNKGWLESSYAKYAQNAFIGMCNYSLDEKGLHYICFKGSTSSYSNVSYDSYVNEGKGVGPFIMAYAEMLKATPYVENTVNELKDESTGVSVETASGTKLNVTDKSTDKEVKTSLNNTLAEGFKAYDITVDDYTTGEEITIKLPISSGLSEDALEVYYVPSEGSPEKITGTINGTNYVFTTKHLSIYAIGVSMANENVASVTGTGTLEGGKVYKLDTDGVDANSEYLIVNTNSGNGYALTNSNGSVDKTEVTINDGQIIVNDDTNIAWTFNKSDSATIKNNNKYVYLNNRSLSLSTSYTNMTIKDQKNGAYKIYYSQRSGRNNNYYYLTYDNEWTGSKATNESNIKSVYLYKYDKSNPGGTVNFSITPSQVSLKTGETKQLISTVTVNDVDATSSTIKWNSSNLDIATVDENGKITAVSDGTTKITATLSSANGTDLQEPIVLEINITVQSKAVISGVLTGNDPVTTKLNVEPNFSNIKLEVTYDDGSTDTIDVDNGLIIDGYDITNIGYSYATISYQDKEYGTVRVTVEGNPYEGKEEADPDTGYPEYPADGAVRIDKTATANAQDFKNTGVTHVELDVAGISTKSAVDVILVTDLSNSMAWEAGTRTDATSHDKTKLYNLKQSVASFADVFLASDENGNKTKNTVSLVTFGGYDADHTKKVYSDYADSTQTLLLGSSDASTVKNTTNNIMLLADDYLNKGTSTTGYFLSFDGGNTYGENYGNTNYDHAFMQTAEAISALKAEYKVKNNVDYDDSGRQIYVLFMTDGAPSNYNGVYYNYKTGDRADVNCTWINESGTETTYTMGNNNSQYQADSWYKYIAGGTYNTTTQTVPGNTLYWADKVYNTTSVANIYNIGFDLDNGGFSSMTFTLADGRPLSKVLEKLVTGKTLNVYSADNETELTKIYSDLATKIKYAGTNAQVADIIDSDFTLQMASKSGSGNNTADLGDNRIITVTTYDLYTKEETSDTTLIGTRKGTSEILETVTFNDYGTEAHSDKVENGEKNIMTTTDDGTVIIEAFYFTYTKTPEGQERFVWTIGNITDKEIVLGYDVYLKGSLEGECPEDIYYTNEEATLEYIDINGKHATKTFPVPAVSWGGATTTIRFYLVDKDGNPVNHAGEIVPLANRVYIGDSVIVPLNLNADITIPAQEIQAASYVPDEYFLYDINASYTVQTASGTDNTIIGGITVSEPSDDAKKTTSDNLGNQVTQTGAQTTKVIEAESTYYTWSTVGFGVRWDLSTEKVDNALEGDKIVVDYGKAIQVDVLDNDSDEIANGFTGELVGFTSYNDSTNLNNIQISAGTTTYNGKYGEFSIIDGKVNYQLNKMISEVEKVFCVVKITETANPNNYYYLYEELDIIPATIMYYETDFASDVFAFTTTSGQWTNNKDSIESDGPQDNGTIGVNQTYGYDSTYTNDKYLSNGSSYFVEGQGIKLNENSTAYTYTDFSFKGTGFDIISRTGENQGAIRVNIYTDEAMTNLVKSVTVLNKSESELELYQIPVVSVNDLDYGTYYVRIGVNAAYSNTTYPDLSRGGEFYFDAIRIYDPINTSSDKDATLVKDAYSADGEYGNEITEVRSMLLDSTTYDSSVTSQNGVLFVDRGQDSVNVGTYSIIGPNNEVYLKSGQAIAFKVLASQVPSSIDIGAKSADGKPVTLDVTIANGSGSESKKYKLTKDIETSTSLYYDILSEDINGASTYFSNGYAYITITNPTDNILSITDIKVAYQNDVASVNYIVDNNVLSFASFCLVESLEPEAPIEPEKPEVVEPNYDIQSAKFTSSSCGLFNKATMTVVTTTDVEELKVTNKNGKELKIETSFIVNEEGMKVWTVKFRPLLWGTSSFTVTGYGSDGTEGASASDSIKVKLF